MYDALVKMSVENPDKGSFRTYAKQAFGRWAGFSNGWVYLISELLIMGSQLMALGILRNFGSRRYHSGLLHRFMLLSV